MSYPLLSGRIGQAATKNLGLPVAGASVLLAILIAAVIILSRQPESPSGAASSNVSMTTPPLMNSRPTHASVELSYHVESMRVQLLFGLEQVSRAQRLTAGTLPELTRNGLWQERRRAEAAM